MNLAEYDLTTQKASAKAMALVKYVVATDFVMMSLLDIYLGNQKKPNKKKMRISYFVLDRI